MKNVLESSTVKVIGSESISRAPDFSIKDNRVKRGELLLLESFGGGMTWGAMVVRY